MNYSFKQLPKRARCGIILAGRPEASATDPLENLITEVLKGLRQALPEADLAGMITEPGQEELLATVFHKRRMGPRFDACIDITLPVAGDFDLFRNALPVLREGLAGAIDPARCCVVVGDAFYASPGYGNFSLTQMAWRDPKVTKEQFLAWWTSHHSDHNLDAPSGNVMQGYAMNHREDPITTDMNKVLGFSNSPEIYIPCYFRDIESLRQFVTPDVAANAFEDEKGFISHDEIRVEIQRVIVQDIV